jgi:hypothetical protein
VNSSERHFLSLDDGPATEPAVVGWKAAALARARRRGLPVLPGYVLPTSAATDALLTGASVLQQRGSGAARRAVYAAEVPPGIATRGHELVTELGRVAIARSSSPLEADPTWAGALSSITEVGPADVETAIRSCWASTFTADAVERMHAQQIAPDRLRIAVLFQRQVRAEFGGTAYVDGADVVVTGIAGHPGPLLAGLADGVQARAHGHAAVGPLLDVMGPQITHSIIDVIRRCQLDLGDCAIEWIAEDGVTYLTQTTRSAPRRPAPPVPGMTPYGVTGTSVPGIRCVEGDAVGRLWFVRPHEPVPIGGAHILVCERPVPALAPLLFAARGIVCLKGPSDSHLAGVARALGKPMLVDVPLHTLLDLPSDLNREPGLLGVISGAQSRLAMLEHDSTSPANQRGLVQRAGDYLVGSHD